MESRVTGNIKNTTTERLKATAIFIFRRGGVYLALVLLFAISAILSPKMIESKYLLNILRATSILGIVSIGQTLLIISRGIDLSVGAHLTLAIVLMNGITLGEPEKAGIAVLIILGIGLLIGLFNGVLVVKLKLEPLVGSLGVMTLIMGIYFIYSQGFPKGSVPPSITYIGTGRLFGFFPVPVFIWGIIAAVIIFILRRTVFGKKIYATGANPKAAFLTGIKTDWIVMSVYLISGFLTALAGIIWAGYLGSATLDGGRYFPLDSIAAVIIGGTTFAGGKGGIGGTIAGAVIMYYLSSFLTVVGLGEAAKLILQGSLILLLVYSYTGRNK